MKLKCKIKGVEYPIIQGCTFTDNFNETLDSGVICIDQVPLIEGLKPYDDVYVYDADSEFNGYYAKGDMMGIKATVGETSINKQSQMESAFGYSDGDTNPSVLKKWLSYSKSKSGMITLTGSLLDIFAYMYGNYETGTERDNLYPVKMPKITIKVKMKDGNDNEYETSYYLSTTYDTAKEALSAGISNPYSKDDVIKLKETDSGIGGGTNTIGERELLRFDTSTNSLIFNSSVYSLVVGGTAIQSLTIESIELVDGYLEYYNGWKMKNTVTLHDVPNFSDGTNYGVSASISLFGITYEAPIMITGKTDSSFKLTIVKPTYPITTMELTATRIGTSDDFSFEYSTIIDTSSGSNLFFTLGILTGFDKFLIETNSYSELPSGFYKHLLIDSFQRQRLNLGSEYSDQNVLYKYQINLMSETKRLEKVILPNISITQPLDASKKRSCWEYMKNFVELYSPKYKKSNGGGGKTWSYIEKYSLGDSEYGYLNGKNGIVTDLKSVFENAICPEMSLSGPSLRDVLSRIMIVKDMIPVVFNGVIYGMDIGMTDLKQFDRNNAYLSYDVGSMSSESYATDARREYSGALSQENSAHMVEYLGFRSPDSAFLNLATMVLETRFPIYKINTLKLCYYKKFTLKNFNDGTTTQKMFLCKYDISKFVLQNEVRNVLSENWEKYDKDYSDIENMKKEKHYTYDEIVSEITQYKMCTVGYSIGSNRITGWGTTYSYLNFLWFKGENSYLENLIYLLERISDIGSQAFMSELQGTEIDRGSVSIDYTQGPYGIVPLWDDETSKTESTNIANLLKSVFFEMDYDAMYSGAVVHGKDNTEDDDITTADNCSSSLTVLEMDGLLEKEKMDRMSNETLRFTGRYDSFGDVQELATKDSATEATIYAREYQIYENTVLANYTAMKEYIMKNYYTSVWAKYRTYNLMSYGESIKRAENHREFILLSKTAKYYEKESLVSKSLISKFVSFLTPSDIKENGKLVNDSKINCGYIDINGGKYLSDINSFACGNSICFNISMYDNASGGVYISSLSKALNWDISKETGVASLSSLFGYYFNDFGMKTSDLIADYKSTQGWYSMISNSLDSFTENVGFYVCTLDSESYFDTSVSDAKDYVASSKKFMELPLLEDSAEDYISGKIGKSFTLYKDNKEKIDFTFQFSYITEDRDILISPWAMKLVDLVGNLSKRSEDTKYYSQYGDAGEASFYIENESTTKKNIVIKIPDDTLEKVVAELNEGKSVSAFDSDYGEYMNAYDHFLYTQGRMMYEYDWNDFNVSLTIDNITEISSDKSTIKLNMSFFGQCKLTKYGFSGYNKVVISSELQQPTSFYDKEITLEKQSDGTYKGTIDTDFNWKSGYYKDDGGLRHEVYWTSNENSKSITIGVPKTGIMAQNMFAYSSTEKLRDTLVYNSYTKMDAFTLIDKEVDEVFEIEDNGDITVHADYAPSDAKSIQYYYKDNDIYYFVFGVNITSNEKFTIRTSAVSKRNMDVYDSSHNVIGKSYNYADGGNVYGYEQYYTEE